MGDVGTHPIMHDLKDSLGLLVEIIKDRRGGDSNHGLHKETNETG